MRVTAFKDNKLKVVYFKGIGKKLFNLTRMNNAKISRV